MSINNIAETILIVDDTPSIALFVQSVLEDKGYKTIVADNGMQGLVMAQEYSPDLILLDIMMPDIDGYAICQQLKADRKTKDIPVIFLSALSSSFDKIKAFKSGAVDFVSKPIQGDELTARVKSHITICSLNRELQRTNKDLEARIAERTKELVDSNKQLVELNSRLEKTVNELRMAKDRADSKNDNKSVFLSKLSHEILNDSNIIEGFAELIKATSDIDKHCEYADCIKDSAANLVSVINNMVVYNNAISGNVKLNVQNVSVCSVLESVYQNNLQKAKRRGLNIIVNNENPDDFSFDVDEDMLYTILNKLVSNSLKFSEKGEIEIGASNTGDTAVFFVKDSGIGINPELLDRIFDPFVRGDKSFDLSGKGLGLGLPIVRSYVQMLNGEIWFDSSPGVGTIFYISLPVKSLPKFSDVNNWGLSGVSVLIGEDEDVSFVLLNEILRSFGIQAIRARTGKELFELCRDNTEIKMIISNLKLPMMNGSEAMKLIRKMRPGIVTVAQISYFSAEDKRAFADSGCDAFIDRPANAQQVREVLMKFLANK
ncbi:MAG: response regulator [Bacteroidales bacterium]|nr:response regulator [Bacteroidales bacterium]